MLNVGIIAMTLVTPLLTGLAVERIDAGDITGADGAFAAALAIALAGLLAATFAAAAGVVNSRLSTVIETDLRSRLYRHFQVVDPRVLDARPTGDLVSLASTDLVPIAQFFGNRLARGLQGVVTMVLAGVIMVWLEPLLALLALAPLPVGVVILATLHAPGEAEAPRGPSRDGSADDVAAGDARRGGDRACLRARVRAARALRPRRRAGAGCLAGRQPDGRSLADRGRHAPARWARPWS